MRKFFLVLVLASASIPALCQSQECTTDPTTFAQGESWYRNNEIIEFNGKKYSKYGLPRVLSADLVEVAGKYRKTDVYVEAGTKGVAEVLYIPVSKDCQFQPYQMEIPECEVAIKLSYAPTKLSTGKAFTFSGTATSKYKTLNYMWQVWITDAMDQPIDDAPDAYDLIQGDRKGKTLVVATKGLKKGWFLNVAFRVSSEGVYCSEKEETTKVQIK